MWILTSGFFRPYGARFQFLWMTPDLRPGLTYVAAPRLRSDGPPPGWIPSRLELGRAVSLLLQKSREEPPSMA